jgi:hypothetical protein
MPTIFDVLRPLGVTKEEIDSAEGVNKQWNLKKMLKLFIPIIFGMI